MDHLKNLGVTSFTVVANDEQRKKSLTKTIASYMVVAGLAIGSTGVAQSAEKSAIDAAVTQTQASELLSAARSAEQPVVTDREHRQHLFSELYAKDAVTVAQETAKDIIAGRTAFQTDDKPDIEDSLPDATKKGLAAARGAGVAFDVTRTIMNPELTAASWATKVTVGTAVAATTNDTNHGLHIASAISGAAVATTLGPVGIGLYAASQTYDTYNYIKESRDRKEALNELRVDVHLALHQQRVDALALQSYKASRAEWADMSEADFTYKHVRYVEAATEHLLDSTQSPWMKRYVELEHQAGMETNEYLPWFSEAVARAYELKAASEADTAHNDTIADSAEQQKMSGVKGLNSLMSAMNENAQAFTMDKEEAQKPRSPGMR